MASLRPSFGNLAEEFRRNPFTGYAYSYPHKFAYRRLDPPVPLAGLWQQEDRENLFLYAHIPFCEMRCGFCNLFTTTHPDSSRVEAYLDALGREAEEAANYLGTHRFARGAIGGGTPSFLDNRELLSLFAILNDKLGGIPSGMPLSFEVSPATVSAEKLSILLENGVTRLSVGVQSFVEKENHQIGRPQDERQLDQALTMIRDAGFPVFNLDLIYGIESQHARTWSRSLDRTLEFSPEEIYLYPLYVRPLTGLGRKGEEASDQRLALYRQGRDTLLGAGYEQISMRLFRKAGTDPANCSPEGPVYCCQEDGMLGLGSGARSYTKSLHYSTEYAVGRKGVNEIINHYLERHPSEFRHADYGCRLGPGEQRRRYAIKSLLRLPGLNLRDYSRVFGTAAMDDFPELSALVADDLAERSGDFLCLLPAGLELSDAIGPWLMSAEVAASIDDYTLR